MKGTLARNANIDLGLAILASTSDRRTPVRPSLHTLVVHVSGPSKLNKKLSANSGQHYRDRILSEAFEKELQELSKK